MWLVIGICVPFFLALIPLCLFGAQIAVFHDGKRSYVYYAITLNLLLSIGSYFVVLTVDARFLVEAMTIIFSNVVWQILAWLNFFSLLSKHSLKSRTGSFLFSIAHYLIWFLILIWYLPYIDGDISDVNIRAFAILNAFVYGGLLIAIPLFIGKLRYFAIATFFLFFTIGLAMARWIPNILA